MNDFTKKELIALEDAMEQRLIDHPPKGGESPLLKKIQCMIDNYCEHDWRKGVPLFNDIYCTKCDKHFEVNNEE